MANKYRLKLSKLQFCSLVDDPAQPNAKTLLIKSRTGAGGAAELETNAQLAKLNEELGLAFFWAFTSTNADGTPHFDLQGDTVDQDFIKAAMEFMLDAGGAVDEMHGYQPTEGRVVFAMPMTPEIAKAFGFVTKQSGLMIAIKATAEQLAKLKDGTFNGVSIAGLGTRELVKSRVAKASLYTDEVKGHAHKICVWEDGGMYVEYATMEGAECGHSHGIVSGPEGKLVILADSGHSHKLAEGQPSLVVVDADAIVVVAARAPQGTRKGNSTTAPQLPTVEITMKTDAEKLADLQKSHTRLERVTKMTGAQFAHFLTLKDDDAEAFLAKSNVERDAALVEVGKRSDEANKIVFMSKSTGEVYRASDDQRLVDMAKRDDARAAEVEKSRFEKRAAEDLGHFAKSLDARVLIIGSVLKSGADKALIDEAVESLKGADSALKQLAKMSGVGDDGSPSGGSSGDALEKFNSGVTDFAKKHDIKDQGLALEKFLGTPEGRAAKRDYDKTRAYGAGLPA